MAVKKSSVHVRGLSFPIRIVEFDDGFRVEMKARDTKTGSLVGILGLRRFSPKATAAQKAKLVREMLHGLVCHEIDEVLSVDGERPFNPHKGQRHDISLRPALLNALEMWPLTTATKLAELVGRDTSTVRRNLERLRRSRKVWRYSYQGSYVWLPV
jgi:hypothetical protein